ncbi:MAG: hypothetical protein MZW92_00620 [Comamonadaceae bacterium]|nr:hypothetical protein [Comamonadaceae bacterium]
MTLAEASAESIRRVTTAIGDQQTPMLYLLGEKYIAALEQMGESGNVQGRGAAGRPAGSGARACWARKG